MKQYEYTITAFKDGALKMLKTYPTKMNAVLKINSMKKTGNYDAIDMDEMTEEEGYLHSVTKHTLVNGQWKSTFRLVLEDE